jgi:hypothetical protein
MSMFKIILDDCWMMDINKRDSWRRILTGSMHNLAWKTEEQESEVRTNSMRECVLRSLVHESFIILSKYSY